MSIEQLVSLMMITERPAKKRVQLDLNDEQYTRLTKLKEKTTEVNGTFVAVVDTSLRLYEFLLMLKDEGSEFVIRQADGKEINTRSLFE